MILSAVSTSANYQGVLVTDDTKPGGVGQVQEVRTPPHTHTEYVGTAHLSNHLKASSWNYSGNDTFPRSLYHNFITLNSFWGVRSDGCLFFWNVGMDTFLTYCNPPGAVGMTSPGVVANNPMELVILLAASGINGGGYDYFFTAFGF